MADLTGQSVSNTYKDLLQVSNNNSGVDTTVRIVEDGEGTESALKLSTSEVHVAGTLSASGHLYLSEARDLHFSSTSGPILENFSAGDVAVNADGDDLFIGYRNTNLIQFRSSPTGSGVGTQRLSINGAGEVEVGPGSGKTGTLLHIASAGKAILNVHSDTNTNSYAALELQRGASDTFGYDGYTDWRVYNSGGNFGIQSGKDQTNTTRMLISYITGNVSIGDSPSYGEEKLSVVGNISATGAVKATIPGSFNPGGITVRSTVDTDLGQFTSNGSYYTSMVGNGYRLDGVPTSAAWVSLSAGEVGSENFGATVVDLDPAGNIYFRADSTRHTGESKDPTTRMTVHGNGGVGIGTTSPTKKLEVIGDVLINNTASGADTVLQIDSGSVQANDAVLHLIDGTSPATAGFKVRYENQTGHTFFDNMYDNSAGAMYFRTRTSGTHNNVLSLINDKVGVGTTAANMPATLTVAGSISASGTITGDISIGGTTTSTTTIQGVLSSSRGSLGGNIAKFESANGSGGTPSTTHNELIIDSGEANVGINILGPANSNQRILFGDAASNGSGQVTYEHEYDNMKFATGGSTKFTITSAGNHGIATGGFVPEYPLHISRGANSGTLLGYRDSEPGPAYRLRCNISSVNDYGFQIESRPLSSADYNRASDYTFDDLYKVRASPFGNGYHSWSLSGGNELMKLEYAGQTDQARLGVGETDPDRTLHLKGSADPGMRIESEEGGGGILDVYQNTHSNSKFKGSNTSGTAKSHHFDFSSIAQDSTGTQNLRIFRDSRADTETYLHILKPGTGTVWASFTYNSTVTGLGIRPGSNSSYPLHVGQWTNSTDHSWRWGTVFDFEADNNNTNNFYSSYINLLNNNTTAPNTDMSNGALYLNVDNNVQTTNWFSDVNQMTMYGLNVDVDIKSNPYRIRGIYSSVNRYGTTGNTYTQYGIAGSSIVQGGCSATNNYGGYFDSYLAGGGTSNYGVLIDSHCGHGNYGAGHTTNQMGAYVISEMGHPDAVAHNNFGVRVINNSLSAAPTHSYQFYGTTAGNYGYNGGAYNQYAIENNYGLYLQCYGTWKDSGFKHYLEGQLGINTVAPEKGAVLHIKTSNGPDGTTSESGRVIFENGNENHARIVFDVGDHGHPSISLTDKGNDMGYALVGNDSDNALHIKSNVGTSTTGQDLSYAATSGDTIARFYPGLTTFYAREGQTEGAQINMRSGTYSDHVYAMDIAAGSWRVIEGGCSRMTLSGESLGIGGRIGSEVYGNLFSLALSTTDATGKNDVHGPNILAEADCEYNFGLHVVNRNSTRNHASGIGAGDAYTHCQSVTGAAVSYYRSDASYGSFRGNATDQGRWIVGHLSNGGPSYNPGGTNENGLGRTFCIISQHSTDQGASYSNGFGITVSDRGNVVPTGDNYADLGSSSRRWDDVYATNSTIQTSDVTLKENINDSALGLDFIKDLRPVSYNWKSYSEEKVSEVSPGNLAAATDTQSVSTVTETIEHNHSRVHYGLIAQEVATALSTAGVETSDFAGYIDPGINGDTDSKLGLRYNEFIAPMIRAIQEQQTIIESLSTRIAALET